MSLTITINDETAEMYEKGHRNSHIKSAVEEARASLERGEVKITLSKAAADYYEQELPPANERQRGRYMGAKVRAFRAKVHTPYEKWYLGLREGPKRAFDCAVSTYKALVESDMHMSARTMRGIVAEQFSEVALEALPK